MNYDIAIVTVSHNDLNEACLSSLERARKASTKNVGVVIVDNASTKYHANELVEKYIPDAVVILRNGDFGFGRSCNRGARELKAKYLFFLNPDTVLPDENLFDKLHAFMEEHPEAGIVAPKITYTNGELQETCRQFPVWNMPLLLRTKLSESQKGKEYIKEYLMKDYDHKHLKEVDWVQGSAIFIPSDLFFELGGFDDRFWMYFEDVDLCRRVWKKGRSVFYLPSAEVQHAHTKASARSGSQLMNFLKNRMARAHVRSWLQYLLKWGFRSR